MQGTIFNVQKFCINDGPGIRTTVFLKGCPLRCKWCHNPESHKTESDVFFDSRKCVVCGKCGAVCPTDAHTFDNGAHIIDREKCIKCGKCCEECPFDALEKTGKTVCIDEVIQDVLKDKVFYETSGGGLTVSGGEPLAQFDFTYALLTKAKENNLHTCIETCAFADTEKILKLAPLIDIFLIDWKITDDALHKEYTGVSNELILKNIKALDNLGARIILRCPIIPGVNDTDEHFCGIAELANSLKNVMGIEIEPYHSLGVNKYDKLGKNQSQSLFATPEPEQVEEWISFIKEKTEINVKKA